MLRVQRVTLICECNNEWVCKGVTGAYLYGVEEARTPVA